MRDRSVLVLDSATPTSKLYDVAPARQLGMVTIRYRGLRDDDTTEASDADHVVERFDDPVAVLASAEPRPRGVRLSRARSFSS